MVLSDDSKGSEPPKHLSELAGTLDDGNLSRASSTQSLCAGTPVREVSLPSLKIPTRDMGLSTFTG